MKRLLFILFGLLMMGCGSTPRPTTIPIQREVREELKQVTLEGDSSTLRMVFEHPLNTIRTVDYQQGKHPSAPVIKWQLSGSDLDITAEAPEQVVEVVERTVYQEVPVEVEVVREVNRLHWWQETLMWLGALALVALLLRVIMKLR